MNSRRDIASCASIACLLLLGCEQRIAPSGPTTSQPASSAHAGGRLVDGAAGFSIDIPDDFIAQSLAGVQSKVLSGPTVEGVTVSISVTVEPFGGTIEEYVASAIDTAKRELTSASISAPSQFSIDAGLPTRRWTTTHLMGGTKLTQEQFVIASAGKVFVITCARASEDTTDWKPIFERSVKSFRTE